MRKSLWIMLAVMIVAVCAPNAHADSFSVTFTCDTCAVAAPTASDVTFPSPTLDIMWQGVAFALTLPSSSLPTDSYTWEADIACAPCTSQMGIVDVTTGTDTISNPSVVPATFSIDTGALTFASVAAPEPSSVGLRLLGVGLVFVMRKRNSRGHQLAA